MSTDFCAFSCRIILDSFQKRVDALESLGEKALAAFSDGTLCVLEPDVTSESAPWQVTQALKGFGKKCLLQLQVWPERSLLLSLDDDGVRAHKLPSFKLHCLAHRTRNAHRFAWDAAQARLAVAVKRRLLIFHYDGNEFAELKDVSLPESALRLAWTGDSVCIGFKKEYTLVNASTGASSELFKLAGEPCMAAIQPSAELLVFKGNVGMFLGPDSRIMRKSGLTWSDAPAAVAYSHPYAVALLPNYVEIRSLQRVSAHGLAQVLPLKGMTVVSARTMTDGSMLLAAGPESGIQKLSPVPFHQQADALADLGEFQEALELAQLIPDSKVDERTRLQDELHTRFGYRLFAESDFDDAMAHFGMCSNANPLVLLNLFPSLAPPQLLLPLEETISGYKLPEMPEPSGDAFQKAVEVLLPYLLSHRSRLASFNAHKEEGAVSPRRQASSEVGRLEPTASGSSPGQGFQMDIGHAKDRQRQLMARAVDTAILKAMLATSDSGALLRFVQRENAVDLGEGEKALQAAGRYSELVALYQSQGRHAEALDLLRKVSQKPRDLPIAPKGAAAELLGVTGVWAAVKYLVTMKTPRLDLVKRHSRWILRADPEAGLEMFNQLDSSLPPSAALPILTAQAPMLCAPYLENALSNGTASASQYHDDLAGIYLQMLLSPDSTSQRRKAEGSNTLHGNLTSSQGLLDPMERLKELVLESQHVDAQRILLMLPSDRLPELRALLLERIGKHQEALSQVYNAKPNYTPTQLDSYQAYFLPYRIGIMMYVHTMHDPVLAEAYCDRMYAAAAKQADRPKGACWLTKYGDPSRYEMYLALISVLLERRDSPDQPGNAPTSSNWEDVARLLSRKHDRIEPLHALQLLPGQVTLKAVLPFLKGALRSSGEQRRNASVVKSLRRAENLSIREENARCKQRSVVVSFERACSICHKRMGTSAFVAYPDGSLGHYSCHNRSEVAKMTSKRGVDPSAQLPIYDLSL